MEAKELELAKDLDRQQADINRLTLQLRDMKRGREDISKQRDTAIEDRKRIQHEMYLALDNRQALEARVRELEGVIHINEQEKLKTLHTLQNQQEDNTQKQNTITELNARIRQLEIATQEIMKAQLVKSSLDQNSILKSSDEIRVATQTLKKTQAQLNISEQNNQNKDAQIDRAEKVIQLQVKQISSQKETIEALSGLVQRLSQRRGESYQGAIGNPSTNMNMNMNMYSNTNTNTSFPVEANM